MIPKSECKIHLWNSDDLCDICGIEKPQEKRESTIEELNAGNEFRDSVMKRADGYLGGDFWHGWVIMDAFLAGVEYQKAKAKQA